MNPPRGVDEHIQLFVAYSLRVAQLSPAAWNRLRVRCADLDGPAFRTLLRRVRLRTRPYELWLPPAIRRPVSFRIIAGASRAVQAGIAFAGEVAAEFDAAAAHAPSEPLRRTRSSGNPRTDAYCDATLRIEATVTPFGRTNPGLVTAIRAAGHAVLLHDTLSETDFDAAYSLIEPEIRFADLVPPSNAL
jgi:hypothetical protein